RHRERSEPSHLVAAQQRGELMSVLPAARRVAQVARALAEDRETHSLHRCEYTRCPPGPCNRRPSSDPLAVRPHDHVIVVEVEDLAAVLVALVEEVRAATAGQQVFAVSADHQVISLAAEELVVAAVAV